MRRLVVLALLGACVALSQPFPPHRRVPAEPADLLYFNGKIVTMNPAAPLAEAVSMTGDRIRAVGSTAEVEKTLAPNAQRVDLKGRTVLPGLMDSHVHPIGAALAEIDGEIPVIHSFADLEAYVKSQIKATKGLIFVPKVYSTRLAEQRYPTRQEIDAWSGGRAVMLDNGYAAALNSAALAQAGISKQTPNPADGKIIRDKSGEPTGLVLGARRLLAPLVKSRTYSEADVLWAIEKMQAAYNKVGLTSVIDRALSADRIRAYQRYWAAGKMHVRTYLTRVVDAERPLEEIDKEIRALGPVTGFGDDMMRVGSLKIFLDGGILIGTAYLRTPYGTHTEVYGFNDPDYRGVLRVPPKTIAGIALLANDFGWQMTAHTTGGASTDALLDAYEKADAISSIKDKRFTLTHANFPTDETIARAKKLGVVMDMQPAWYHLDGDALSKVLGPERMKYFQPYKSVFDAGVIVAGGSDHMIKFDSRNAINPYNPFFGMWMVVSRKTAAGQVFNPEQKLTREQALKMWTWNAAYLSFEEDIKGSLEPGKLADLAVIDRDILTCPEDEIRDIEVLRTVLGGKTVYDSGVAF